jgi:hypothetical protein
MATTKKFTPVTFTVTERVGQTVGAVPDLQPGLVAGFRMSRHEQVREQRRVSNARRIDEGVATLLAELS